MSDLVYLKIDVTKIAKEKLFQGKNGAKYLDAVMIPKKTAYGDFMIVQSATREERARGERGAILGNGKYADSRSESQPSLPATSEDDSQIPF